MVWISVPLAHAAPVEIRALGGTQIDSDSHGEVDVGVRSGGWSAELFTDTIDLRWSPAGERGRTWIALRAEGVAAGLMITPWRDGRPDPKIALVAGYAGPEGGTVRYLDHGWYAGVEGSARVWFFHDTEETEVEVPEPTFVGNAEAFFGASRGAWGLAGWVRGGAYFVAAQPTSPDLLRYDCPLPSQAFDACIAGFAPVGAPVDPTVSTELTWHHPGTFSPRVELRAGLAEGVGGALATRVGGEMPYVVPLAGAAWAEFWVDRYAAARLGFALGDGDAGPGSGMGAETFTVPSDGRIRIRGMAFVDLVAARMVVDESLSGWNFTPIPAQPTMQNVGFAARAEIRRKRVWLQTEAGWAPWIERGDGVQNWSVMVRAGLDWTPVGAAKNTQVR